MSLRVFLNESFPLMEQNPGATFHDDWFYDPICEHAQALLSGQLRRLVVTTPPGTYKSRTWMVCFVAWAWLRFPHLKFLCGANETELAIRDSIKCRALITSPWYQSAFAPAWRLSFDQDAKKLFSNTEGGHRQVTSAGSSTVGKKFDVGLVDDLHDATTVRSPAVRETEKYWFLNSFWDRQNDFTTSSICLIAHPLHPQDITRELINRGWAHLNLPERMEPGLRKTFPLGGTDTRRDDEYLRPERFGPAEEADVKANQGEGTWRAKYQCDPATSEATMFPRDRVARLSAVPAGTTAVRYWDTAATKNATSSYTSGVLLGRYERSHGHWRWVVVDVKRGRWSWYERNEVIKATAAADRWRTGVYLSAIWIEHPGGSGGVESADVMVAGLAGFNVHVDRVAGQGDKATRAGPFSAQWCAGNVDVVDGPWVDGYLDRMEMFPALPDRDDTDASAGAFNKQALLSTPDVLPGTGRNFVDSMPGDTLPAGRIDVRRERW